MLTLFVARCPRQFHKKATRCWDGHRTDARQEHHPDVEGPQTDQDISVFNEHLSQTVHKKVRSFHNSFLFWLHISVGKGGRGYLGVPCLFCSYNQLLFCTCRQSANYLPCWHANILVLKWFFFSETVQLKFYFVILHVRREAANKVEDEEEWEADILDEMQEIQHEIQEEFEKMLDNYQTQLENWKKQRLRKVRSPRNEVLLTDNTVKTC